MLALPILNVHLQACPASWQQMAPTPQGRHCAHCNREVVDFTNSTAADLKNARAAAPDGHLCGRFRQSQLADSRPQLRPRLRRFLVALVLVCGLGLSGREALAQVRAAGSKPAQNRENAEESNALKPVPGSEQDYELPANTSKPVEEKVWLGTYIEQMPEYPGGFDKLLQFIAQNTHYPAGATKQGRVFIGFIVTKTGFLDSIRLLKGLEPALDTEALRIARLIPLWIPAKQNGRPVDVSFVLPIYFSAYTDSFLKNKRKK